MKIGIKKISTWKKIVLAVVLLFGAYAVTTIVLSMYAYLKLGSLSG